MPDKPKHYAKISTDCWKICFNVQPSRVPEHTLLPCPFAGPVLLVDATIMWRLAGSTRRCCSRTFGQSACGTAHKANIAIDSVIEPSAGNELHWTAAVLGVRLLYRAEGKTISGQTINGQRSQLAGHFRLPDLLVVVVVVNVVTAAVAIAALSISFLFRFLYFCCCVFFIFLLLVELKFDNAKASRQTQSQTQAQAQAQAVRQFRK